MLTVKPREKIKKKKNNSETKQCTTTHTKADFASFITKTQYTSTH